MHIPTYIRRAAKVIDRVFLAPRRRRKLMRALGVEDTVTKFDLARKHHRSTQALQKQIAAANLERLRREVRHG